MSVSYENIVYEDALTILSYASPYPVKLLLEKSPSQTQPSPILGPRPRRLSHPLFRSRSQDAMDARPSPSPKRSRSSVTKHSEGGKGTGGRLFLKWKSGGGRSGNKPGSKPSSPKEKLSLQNDEMRKSPTNDYYGFTHPESAPSGSHHQDSVTTVAIVSEEVQKGGEQFYSGNDLHDGRDKESPQLEQIPVSPLPVASDVMIQQSAPAVHVKAAPPGKPERKNRRKSDLQYEQQAALSTTNDQTLSSLPSPDVEVQEEAIVPAKSDRQRETYKIEAEEETRDLEGALDIIRSADFTSLEQSPPQDPSPPATPVEEEAIVPISRAPAETNNNIKSPSDLRPSSLEDSEQSNQNQEQTKQQQQPPPPPPGLDDESLERIIAMNSLAPGTQGWAGLRAGGIQGGIKDDFVPDHPIFTSYPVVGDNHSISSSSSNSTNPNSGSFNRGLAYELRDDIVSGRPVVVGLSGKGRVASSGRQDSAASDTTTTSSGKGQGQGEGSECSDSLDWSGQRLVRSPSFSNIFITE